MTADADPNINAPRKNEVQGEIRINTLVLPFAEVLFTLDLVIISSEFPEILMFRSRRGSGQFQLCACHIPLAARVTLEECRNPDFRGLSVDR